MKVLEAILSVFTAVGEWISGAFTALQPVFYDATAAEGAGSLTFMGVLAVAGLAFSIVFLVLNVIQNFLHFRG